MSSMCCRNARAAPLKNIRAAYSTGRLSSSCESLRSRPNGVASSCPNTFVPTLDQARIARVNTSASTKRLRIWRAIWSIE